LHQVLAWNPCYVVSAAVLLFGAFSVTSDPAFRGHDLARLGFNFGSLQLYEALLIGTALFLARRAIWYDSLLLVTLENLLVLVPLILINEAALLDGWVVGVLCGAGAALALGRFGVLRRWMPQLNLPRGVLGVGAVILAVNLILPILFRHFHESKVGTRVTEGPAYELFQATWLVLLPLATALFWLVPLAGMSGSAGPRSRWFPPAFFLLWLAGTGVHAWSLGYVYDFEVLPRHLAPLLWTLGWLGWARLGEVWPARTERASFLVLLIPVLATFLTATADGLGAFRLLTSINLFSFAALILFRRGGHILWHLAAGSAIALLMTLPTGWVNLTRPTLLNLGRTELLLALVGCYLLIWVARSRRPLLAIVGAVIAASLAGGWFNGRPECVHLAAQTGLLFFLLHSLRWDHSVNPDTRRVRTLAILLWILHSWSWVALAGGHARWMVACSAAVAGAVYGIHRWLGGDRWPWLPGAGLAVLISAPLCSIVRELQSAPAGVLAVLASFGFFGLGTLLALTRPRWDVPARREI
jgi:hypothetical protein